MAERDPYQSKHVRRGVRQFISGRLIQAGASVGVMLITVRVMSIGEYALYITATALATFLGGVSILGLDRVLTRYVPEGRLKATSAQLIRFINKMNGLRLLAVGGLALAAALGWPYLAPQVNLPVAGLTLPVLLFAIVHAFVLFQGIVMQSLMLQAGLRNATTATWLLRIALLLGAVYAMPPLDAELAVWITLISETVGWLWMVITTGKHYVALRHGPQGDEPRDAAWPGKTREILRFGWHNYLMGQASFPAQARVQQLVVAVFFPLPVVAGFGFFRNLSEQIRNYLPFQLMKNLAEPVMIGRYVQTQDFPLLNVMTTALLKVNILLIAPLAAWLWVAAGPAIALLTDGKFADQAWLLGVLVVSQIVSSQVTLLVIASNAIGHSHRLPAATITASICTVLLLWTQIPVLGIAALALSDMVFGAVTVFMVVRSMRRVGYRYRFGGEALLRMAVIAMLVAGLGWLVMRGWTGHETALAAVITGFVMLVLYWGLNMVWKPFNEKERELLKKITGRAPMPF
jgi:O-antigen/teichoic acid export membrane protein